ncbi:hypothetical protein HBB16_09010 [Pseudonocardia sp. MCCB 268]|nr:hypothetical protein [Pseudonocardia cytotoxica]
MSAALSTTTTTTSARLAPQPGELIDRSRLLGSVEREDLPAHPGDTIASALAAAGERSAVPQLQVPPAARHPDRGLPRRAALQVGDEPNVRGGHRLVHGHGRPLAEHHRPSLRFDVKGRQQPGRAVPVDRLLLQDLHQARAALAAVRSVLRQFVHAGTVSPSRGLLPTSVTPTPTSSSPAARAGQDGGRGGRRPCGRQVMLVEEGSSAARLRWGSAEDLATLRGCVRRSRRARIRVLENSVALARYDDNWIPIVQRGLPNDVRTADQGPGADAGGQPGAHRRPYVFAGNDLPGVCCPPRSGGSSTLYAVRPGTRAVVMMTASEEQ